MVSLRQRRAAASVAVAKDEDEAAYAGVQPLSRKFFFLAPAHKAPSPRYPTHVILERLFLVVAIKV